MTNQPEFWANQTEQELQEIAPMPPTSDSTPPEAWLGGVHPDGQLEVTSGFHLHADKFSRVLDYLAHKRQSTGSIYDQLVEITGMSKTQIKAFVQYGVRLELLAPHSLRIKPLCALLLQNDPFFDRPATLWLLHYLFSSNSLLVIWNYMCNDVLPAVVEISKAEAAEQFLPFIGRWSEDSIRKNVKKELRAFFADYTRAIFARLDYLVETGHNVYAVNRKVTPVPPLIVLATSLIYRDRHQPGSSGVEIPTLVYADHSPGRLMRQSELAMRQTLDQLHETHYLTIESKANLDQVRFRPGLTWLEAVRGYYQEKS